jgi:hypothetical protein
MEGGRAMSDETVSATEEATDCATIERSQRQLHQRHDVLADY